MTIPKPALVLIVLLLGAGVAIGVVMLVNQQQANSVVMDSISDANQAAHDAKLDEEMAAVDAQMAAGCPDYEDFKAAEPGSTEAKDALQRLYKSMPGALQFDENANPIGVIPGFC